MCDLSHRTFMSFTVTKTHPVPLKDLMYFSKEREVCRLFIILWESLALQVAICPLLEIKHWQTAQDM